MEPAFKGVHLVLVDGLASVRREQHVHQLAHVCVCLMKRLLLLVLFLSTNLGGMFASPPRTLFCGHARPRPRRRRRLRCEPLSCEPLSRCRRICLASNSRKALRLSAGHLRRVVVVDHGAVDPQTTGAKASRHAASPRAVRSVREMRGGAEQEESKKEIYRASERKLAR